MAENVVVAKDEHAAALGRRGGKARLVRMTAEERTRIARLAAQARWAKKATAPDPTDPQGPKRDQGSGRSIMSTPRIPCRNALHTKNPPSLAAQIRLFEAA